MRATRRRGNSKPGSLVSLEDFETETLAISAWTKAAAAWQLLDNVPQVVLTVLMETGRTAEIDSVRATLAGYNSGRGPNRFSNSRGRGRLEYVLDQCTFGYDSTYLPEESDQRDSESFGREQREAECQWRSDRLFSVHRRSFWAAGV